MYYGFVKCDCGGTRKVFSSDQGIEEHCSKCGYSGMVACKDIYVYLIKGACKE